MASWLFSGELVVLVVFNARFKYKDPDITPHA